MLENEASIWIPVANDSFLLTSGVTNNNGTITFQSGNTDWNRYALLNDLKYTYAELEGKRIRVSFDYTITGTLSSSNRGIVFSVGEYNTQQPINNVVGSGNADNRKNNVSLPDCKDASGSFYWEETLSTTILRNRTDLHNANNYMGGVIFLMANSNVSATVSNLVYEFYNGE